MRLRPVLQSAPAAVAEHVRPAGPAAGETAAPLAALLEPAPLAAAIDACAARHPGGCRRAAASVWSKHLFAALLPGPVAAATGGVALAADGSALSVVLRDGSPAALDLRSAPPAATLDRATAPLDALAQFRARAYGRLLAGPVADAVARVAAAGGLSPRVPWSNAANLIAWLFETLDARTPAAARADRAALLDAPRTPWFPAGNALHGHIGSVVLDAPDLPPRVRRRRVCCLRDRLPGQALCYSCPKVSPEQRAAILRALA